ncbi:bifunctional aspartate kinase/homoserine dehydrogenase I [Prolixibacteraceae bacterium JC049]|nr:bifunctional aspartate kinase/homoserine dehydrogenase I [Prolixibacteraceae bacterium JC049]
MKVLKFGGTSVGSADALKNVKQIVSNQDADLVVIVSAFGGVTDKLIAAARHATTRTSGFNTNLKEIKQLHSDVISELFEGEELVSVRSVMEEMLAEVEWIINGISMLGELTPRIMDRLLSFGERISSFVVSKYLNTERIKSEELIKTDLNHGQASVDFVWTNSNIRRQFDQFSGVAVAPGFVASSPDDIPTTLGRGGSDYTASIFAAALNADELEIWTDVDGFMTADPRVISKTHVIPQLTYSEAMELSHFGAKVIYPPTIIPVYQKQIPIWIKNTFNAAAEGTLITADKVNGTDKPIKGISSIKDISLMTVQGIGMVGVAGISSRLFGALAKEKVNVILISQASSENSISFAIKSADVVAAEAVVRKEFDVEIRSGQINKVESEHQLSIVAVVGENMKQTTGIAGKLFGIIGKNGINIVAIAQGASELNISWVVREKDLRKTLNVVHEAFFLSPFAELNVFLMGIGTVGGKLINQISEQQERLMKSKRLRLKVVGLANSKKMIFDRDGIDLKEYKAVLDEKGQQGSDELFVQQMKEMNVFNSVFVDCTASKLVSENYLDVLNANISIVAANKEAASSELGNYQKLKKTAAKKGVKFLFETNVGAGLPVITTLNDMIYSGDRILKIEAVLSGTLNFIFNTISESVSLSEAIRQAKEQGYSEPDPRVDLSGLDVVRKLVILARESGYPLEQSQVEVNKFIPDELFDGSMDSFWANIPELNIQFEDDRKKLASEGKKWRFVASFDQGKAEVGLKAVGAAHPFYDLEGSNNIILFTTERYDKYPMQIKGYGAGAEVTAAGVFADIIRVSNV